MLQSSINQQTSPANVANRGLLQSTTGLCLLIVLIALTARLSYNLTVEVDTPFRADAGKYTLLAYNIAQHGAYSLSQQAPYNTSTLITPGYPLFLSAIFKLFPDTNAFYMAVLILQAILGSISACLVYLIAKQCGLSMLASLGGALLYAIAPHQIITGGFLLTETLFTSCLLGGLYSLLLARNQQHYALWILSGALLGYACLIRPIAIPIPFLLLGALFLLDRSKHITKHYALMSVTVLLILTPWIIFTSLNNSPTQVSNAKSVFALGTYPNFTYKDESYKGFPHREDPNYPAMQKSITVTLDNLWQRASEEPGKYIEWYLWGKPSTLWQWDIIQGAGGAFIYPVKSSQYHKSAVYYGSYWVFEKAYPYLLLLTLGAISLLVISMFKMPLSGNAANLYLLAIIVLYITGAHMIFASLPRFSIPFQALIFIMALSIISLWKQYGPKS